MLTLIRQIIHIHDVKSEMMGDIGVIRISEFTEQTNNGVRAAMKALRTQSGGRLRGLILDLRNDPGGCWTRRSRCPTTSWTRRHRLDARPPSGR